MAQRIGLIGGLVGLLAVAGVLFFFFRAPEEASAPIAAIPIVTTTPAPAAPTEAPTAAPTTAPAADQPTAAPTIAQPTAAPTEAAAAAQIFGIASAESEARFLIDEVLNGSPVTVVGTTDQIAGQIAIDVANPANTQIGVIQINARTLATDNNFRNRAIRNAILDTNSFEFITFTPTSLAGLPEQATIGQAFTFQIIGDLTVKDVTRSVTFEVTVTPIDENQIRGEATTTIRHADFGLLIPDVPSVSDVSDEVRLELEFVAYPVA